MLGILEAQVSHPGYGAFVGSSVVAAEFVAAIAPLPPPAARSFDGACYRGTCRSR